MYYAVRTFINSPQEQQWDVMKPKRVLEHGHTLPETWQYTQQEGYGLQYAAFHNRKQYEVYLYAARNSIATHLNLVQRIYH